MGQHKVVAWIQPAFAAGFVYEPGFNFNILIGPVIVSIGLTDSARGVRLFGREL